MQQTDLRNEYQSVFTTDTTIVTVEYDKQGSNAGKDRLYVILYVIWQLVEKVRAYSFTPELHV